MKTRWKCALAVSLIIISVGIIERNNLGVWVLRGLEARFPRRPAPCDLQTAAAVIVLGGGLLEYEADVRDHRPLTGAASRILATADLARRYPSTKVIYTDAWEAHRAALVFEDLGIVPDRILLEDQAKDTIENAKLTENLVHPLADQQWILVTSAFHMARSVGLFRRAGFAVVPYPVGPILDDPEYSSEQKRSIATKELQFLMTNWLFGLSDDLYPGPHADDYRCSIGNS